MKMPLDICLPDIYPCGCPDERHWEWCMGLEMADISNDMFMEWLSKLKVPRMFQYEGKNYTVSCHEVKDR